MAEIYTPYDPSHLPVTVDLTPLISLLGKANRAIAKYDALLRRLPNPALLVSAFSRDEALLSSKIEGTHVDTIDLLKFEAGDKADDEDKKNDILEVLNYNKALMYAIDDMKDRGAISLDLIKRLHKILMEGVRGKKKLPGEIRTSQNYIGDETLGISHARFIPPDPLNVPLLLDNLIDYLHMDDSDPILQAAFAHAQFEIIHPFCDGNGRLGRMLISLIFADKKLIERPYFYLSRYFEANEKEYKNALKVITHGEGWPLWLEFFVRAVHDQATYNYDCANKILDAYERFKITIQANIRSQHSIKLLDAIMVSPIFRQKNLQIDNAPTRGTLYSLIKKFEELKIVESLGSPSGSLGELYICNEIMKLCM